MVGKVSVVIPTKDKVSRLRLILKALEPQVHNNIQIIIVFDGCSESTMEEFKQLHFSFQPETVVCQQGGGRAAARNKGLHEAKGDIIIFLDDDRIPCPDFLKKHMEGHIEECVLLGERKDVKFTDEEITDMFYLDLKTFYLNITNRIRRDLYNDIKRALFLRPYHPLRYIGFITGNVSIDRSIIDRIGGFDERYKGWGYEDTDLGYRIVRENIKYIQDDSIINYHLLHSRSKRQKSKEELINLSYISDKFKDDPMFQRVVRFYRLKARLLL